jgi:hypothetical protein
MIEFTVPYPFRFNPSKHHLNWICEEIYQSIKTPGNSNIRDEFLHNIQSMNSNQIDIYTGSLLPLEIIEEIKHKTEHTALQTKLNFKLWLNKQEFKLVEIKDTSVWVLREGHNDNNYIHIHPARTKPHSIRIHGNSLKTAILHILLYQNKPLTLMDINYIRSTYLDLSPVKNLETCERIRNTISFLNQNITIASKSLPHRSL